MQLVNLFLLFFLLVGMARGGRWPGGTGGEFARYLQLICSRKSAGLTSQSRNLKGSREKKNPQKKSHALSGSKKGAVAG